MSKIRTGFVSNSSSSSFVVYGVDLDNDEFLSLCVSLYSEKTSEELEEMFDEPWNNFKLNIDEKIGLDVISDWECEYHLIGREFKTIGDNETGLEFKNSVEEKISAILPREKCRIIETEMNH